MEDTLIITLRRPVELAGEAYTTLNLREPTAAELVDINKITGTEGDIYAVSRISGVPKAAIEKIGARDLLKGARYLAGFLEDDRLTGDNASTP